MSGLALAGFVVLAALAPFSSAAGGQNNGDPATHPHPIPCAPAPCRGTLAAAGRVQTMASSVVSKFTITPHVAHVGDIVRMRLAGCGNTTRETVHFCMPINWEQIGAAHHGSFALGNRDIPCPAAAPGPPASADFCFKVEDDAFGLPQWYVIAAAPYACNPADCLSEDYFTIDEALAELGGTVTGSDDQPLARVKLRAVDRNRRSHTFVSDAAGGYVGALPTGKVRISALAKHACPASRTLNLQKNRSGVNFTVGLLGRATLGPPGPKFPFTSVTPGGGSKVGGPVGGKRGTSTTALTELDLVKPVDEVSPALFQALMSNRVFPKATVVVFAHCKTVLRYTLSKATVGNVTAAGAFERVTLSAAHITVGVK